jgi:hypothetical protein
MHEPSPLILVVAALLVLGGPLLRASVRSKRRNRILAEARQFMESVQQRRALSPVPTALTLRPGEHAFYCAASVLRETRLVQLDQPHRAGTGLAGRLGLRRVGGHSVWVESSSRTGSGVLTVTNQRLVFVSRAMARSLLLDSIAQVDSDLNWVELELQDEPGRLRFRAANPLILAAIIRLCLQVDNPLDLADTTVHLTLVD